ncbi:hypothetical protein CR513_11708, partial [Mucuna pruriens]
MLQVEDINGQDTSSSKTPDLQYGKQHITIWDQRSQPITNETRKPNDPIDVTGKATCCWITSTKHKHPTDMCPTLQEIESDHPESVGAIGVPAKYEHHNLRPQDTDRTTSQHCESSTFSWVRKSSLTNNSKFEGECEHSITKKWERITSTAIARTLSARKPESDEELLKIFRKVEINILLLDAIKHIPKYAKFLRELCVHKRKKMKRRVSTLTKNDAIITRSQQDLQKKCQNPKIFYVPCTIGDCIFPDAMLDLGTSINVMPTSIYKSLNFGDLEPTGMTVQLANRSVFQPFGVLEDVLV